MISLHTGQCGLCAHFGEHGSDGETLQQIRVQHKAPETLIEECAHPKHADLHLQVTPISGCDGFKPAKDS